MRFRKNKIKCELNDFKNYITDKTSINLFLINGIFCSEISDTEDLPDNFFFGKLSMLPEASIKTVLDIAVKGECSLSGGFFSTLNTACLEDITVMLIPENLKIEKTICIISINEGQNNKIYVNQKLVVMLGKNSFANLFHHHLGKENSEYFDNTTVSIYQDENSRLQYKIFNQAPDTASHIITIHVDVQKNSFFECLSTSKGGYISRTSLGIDLNGLNAKAHVKGLALASNSDITDFHTRISHNYPECVSTQLQKNLVSNEGHAIFAGKIQVHSGCFNTESQQLCKTLLLSSSSRVDSMPILEINNDNVKCTHGSTVSDLDLNQIFYFQSRGISKETARNLLIDGFIRDMILEFPEKIQYLISKSI